MKKKTALIFLLSFLLSLAVLKVGDHAAKDALQRRMLAGAAASARESDGACNRVVMNGKPGYLGSSTVYLKYLKDGWIALSGSNEGEANGWKLLSSFTLEPGIYTLTGLKGEEEETVALQLHLAEGTKRPRYLYQFDEDVVFCLEQETEATLHVRVYPQVGTVDAAARPAVYREA